MFELAVCVIGLPGSGKTFFANRFTSIYNMCYIADDFSMNKEMHIQNIKNLSPRTVVFTDPLFCRYDENKIKDHIRETFKLGDKVLFLMIYFENDPERCIENARLRNDGRNVIPDIIALSRNYKIPQGARTYPVYKA